MGGKIAYPTSRLSLAAAKETIKQQQEQYYDKVEYSRVYHEGIEEDSDFVAFPERQFITYPAAKGNTWISDRRRISSPLLRGVKHSQEIDLTPEGENEIPGPDRRPVPFAVYRRSREYDVIHLFSKRDWEAMEIRRLARDQTPHPPYNNNSMTPGDDTTQSQSFQQPSSPLVMSLDPEDIPESSLEYSNSKLPGSPSPPLLSRFSTESSDSSKASDMVESPRTGAFDSEAYRNAASIGSAHETEIGLGNTAQQPSRCSRPSGETQGPVRSNADPVNAEACGTPLSRSRSGSSAGQLQDHRSSSREHSDGTAPRRRWDLDMIFEENFGTDIDWEEEWEDLAQPEPQRTPVPTSADDPIAVSHNTQNAVNEEANNVASILNAPATENNSPEQGTAPVVEGCDRQEPSIHDTQVAEPVTPAHQRTLEATGPLPDLQPENEIDANASVEDGDEQSQRLYRACEAVNNPDSEWRHLEQIPDQIRNIDLGGSYHNSCTFKLIEGLLDRVEDLSSRLGSYESQSREHATLLNQAQAQLRSELEGQRRIELEKQIRVQKEDLEQQIYAKFEEQTRIREEDLKRRMQTRFERQVRISERRLKRQVRAKLQEQIQIREEHLKEDTAQLLATYERVEAAHEDFVQRLDSSVRDQQNCEDEVACELTEGETRQKQDLEIISGKEDRLVLKNKEIKTLRSQWKAAAKSNQRLSEKVEQLTKANLARPTSRSGVAAQTDCESSLPPTPRKSAFFAIVEGPANSTESSEDIDHIANAFNALDKARMLINQLGVVTSKSIPD